MTKRLQLAGVFAALFLFTVYESPAEAACAVQYCNISPTCPAGYSCVGTSPNKVCVITCPDGTQCNPGCSCNFVMAAPLTYNCGGGSGSCTPTTSCAAQGKNCGTIFDGCNTVSCGSCTPCQTCSSGVCSGPPGTPNPRTCTSCGSTFGAACTSDYDCKIRANCEDDGMGGYRCSNTGDPCYTPGTCSTECSENQGFGSGATCSPATYTCCTPATCASAGKNCGFISDGCGSYIHCGDCGSCGSCGGAGTDNVCGGTYPISCGRQNLLTGVTATASSTYSGFPASYVVDGNFSTRWVAATNTLPGWIELDLGAAKTVTGMQLTAQQLPTGAATYVIYGGVSPAPTSMIQSLSQTVRDGMTLYVDFASAVTVRYLRVTTTATSYFPAWYEIRAYGGPTSGTCSYNNGCGATTCGTCCTPTTCAALGKTCGTWSDGCGGTLNCGGCGSGCCTAGTCTTPSTCSSKGWSCGSFTDECGNPVSCGSCAATACCMGNACITKRTCQPGECGQFDDNCGGFLDCGLCPSQCASPESDVPNLTFGAGSIIIPMDICYNAPGASASTGYVDWNAAGTVCTTASAANTPTCYPPSYSATDTRKPYGLMYLLTINNIPVYIINKAKKIRLTDADFTITPPASSTKNTVSYLNPSSNYAADDTKIPCNTNPVSYWGMPFVVESAQAQQAIRLIKDFNANPGMYVNTNTTKFDSVPIHVSNYPFTAPVLTIRSNRPKPVGVSPTNFFDGFFDESGITAVAPFGTSAVYLNQTQSPTAGNNMTAQYSFSWPSVYPTLAECPGRVCTGLVSGTAPNLNRILDVIWTDDADLQWWKSTSGLYDFFKRGGRVLNVGRPQGGGKFSGATSWETGSTSGASQSGNFIASAGLKGSQRNNAYYCPGKINSSGVGVSGPTTDYPASDPYFQLGGLLMDTVGGGQAADFAFKSAAAPGSTPTRALWGVDEAAVLHFKPVITGTPSLQTPGDIIYLGSSNAWSGGSGRKDSGLHVLYNVLVNDNDCGILPKYSDVELSRSTPVGKRTGEFFLGTFDWKVPLTPSLPGAVLYEPPVGQFPYATGHFRQYNPAAGVGNLVCDPTILTSTCNWDAATQMKPWAQRNIFVGKRTGSPTSGYSFTTVTAASLYGSDATIKFIADNIGVKLGGMDYSTAAVIESKGAGGLVKVANAISRPTVAYVGSRDGMLHAFCAQPGGCYTNPNTGAPYAAGDELWALITPGLKASMDTAKADSDWSQLNAGGVVRVADFKGKFNGPSGADSYRTVLVFGTRSSGRIAALDVSDPNPALINQDGLKFLWEQDGTDTYNSADACANSSSPACSRPATTPTAYAMGRTHGATFAGNGTTAFVVATSSISTALVGSTQSGINTYVLRLWDGKVLLSNQKLFTRKALLAGGSSGPIPNNSPAPPVTIDVTGRGDGLDETILVADFEGQVRKMVLNVAANVVSFNSSLTGLIFDTSVAANNAGNPCPAANDGAQTVCQPLGAPPAIGIHDPNNDIAAFVATGGVDFHRNTSIQSYVFGFDLKDTDTVSVKTAFFASLLGTVSPPAPPGTVSTSYPNHAYSQPSISGTDLYVQGTQQALNSINDLINPIMYPGLYGGIFRFSGLNGTSISQATNLIPAYTGSSFSGGGGSVLVTNNGSSGGQLSISGSSQIVRVNLDNLSNGNSSRATSQYAVQTSSAGAGSSGRSFTVLNWFDLQLP